MDENGTIETHFIDIEEQKIVVSKDIIGLEYNLLANFDTDVNIQGKRIRSNVMSLFLNCFNKTLEVRDYKYYSKLNARGKEVLRYTPNPAEIYTSNNSNLALTHIKYTCPN